MSLTTEVFRREHLNFADHESEQCTKHHHEHFVVFEDRSQDRVVLSIVQFARFIDD
jgi:hypothetical protein